MQLTIRKWLDIGLTAEEQSELQRAINASEEIRRYARNWDSDWNKKSCLSDALTAAFTWSTSPQGHEYWDVIYRQNRRPEIPSVQQETIQQTNMSTNLTQIQGRSIVTLWNGHLALEDNCTAVITSASRESYCLTDELDDHEFSQCTIGCREGEWMHNDLLVKSDYSSNLIWVDDDELNTTYDGNKFHTDEADTYSIVWCESDSEWAHQDDCEYGWVDRRNEGYFIRDNNEYCHSDRDDVYFINSSVMHDRDYSWCERLNDYVHCDDYISDDDDDDDDDNCVRGYHHFSRVNAYERDTPKWTIGFEIEKEDRGAKTLNDANDIYSAIKWCHESDGSLDSHSGFELVSPVFDMYDQDMISKHFNHPYIKPLIDAAFNHESCGGHINIASTMYTPSQLADGLSAFFPLLYSMYESRITKSYSKAKQKHQYFSSADKYSSVYIKANVVELRIFPAVRNVENLQWRLDLVRFMVENINKSEIDVLRMMLNPRTRLHKLLAKVFTPEKIFEKSNLYIKYSEMYNGRKLSMPKKKK